MNGAIESLKQAQYDKRSYARGLQMNIDHARATLHSLLKQQSAAILEADDCAAALIRLGYMEDGND